MMKLSVMKIVLKVVGRAEERSSCRGIEGWEVAGSFCKAGPRGMCGFPETLDLGNSPSEVEHGRNMGKHASCVDLLAGLGGLLSREEGC